MAGDFVTREAGFPHVAVEYHGQVVSPCVVLRKAGPFLRVVVPVVGEEERLRWIPRWRVIARGE